MPVPLDPAGNPELCPELARLLGVLDTAGVNPEPSTPLDWALSYAAKGIHVFPAERHLGVPLVTDWHREATTCPAIIERWWSRTGEGREGHEWRRADIGAAPSKSGHFVLSAHHDEGGIASLDGR